MRTIITIVVLSALLAGTAIAEESYKKLNDEGSKAFQKGDYDKALKLLEEAKKEKPGDPIVNFNLGSAYHQQGDYDSATTVYENAMVAKDSLLQSYANYNTGNTEFRQGDYNKAIES